MITRMKQRKDFLAAAASGHKWVRPAFVLQCAPNAAHPETAQIGFTTTKKLGGAVIRNRIRRRLREAARLHLPPVAQAGHDYVIIGREAARDMDFAQLGQELAEAMQKLHRNMQARRCTHST
jgi:ribonuclease P protein component